MNYFNIALLPIDAAANAAFVEQAQSIKNYADGYLLGQEAEPHVTLCQFSTDQELPALQSLWEAMTKLKAPHTIDIAGIDVWEGLQAHESFDWVVWAIVEDTDLTLLQREIFTLLADSDHYLIPLTHPHRYRPHVTLGRVHEDTVSKDYLQSKLQKPGPFRVKLALGQSSVSGAWQKTLLSV